MEPGWDGYVKLLEGRYWSVSLRAGVSGSGGGGVSVSGTDGVGSGRGVGGAVGCGDSGRNVGGGWLCGGDV